MAERIRVQFDLTRDKRAEIEQAMKATRIPTMAQYLNYAFTVFKWAQEQARQGRKVVGLDEATGKYRELSMPPLDALGVNRLHGSASEGGNSE
jgi:hypothetical protein